MPDLKLVGAVAIKVRPDARGFRGETQRAITRELAEVEGKVKVTVDANTSPLANEVRRAKEKIDKTKVNLQVGLDYDSLMRAQRQLESAIKHANTETIEVKLDQKGIEDARAFLQSLKEESKVEVEFVPDKEGYEAVLAKIEEIKRHKLIQKLEFEIDDESLRIAEEEIRAKLRAMEPVKDVPAEIKVDINHASVIETKRKAEKLKQDIDDMKAKMQVEPQGLALMAARLKFAGRDRFVNFYVKVNEKSLIVAEGLLKSLAGINTLREGGQLLERLFTNFDTIALKVGGVAAALGNVANMSVAALTSLFSIGEGVLNVVGLLAAAPAAIALITAGVLINIAAWKDFKSAVDGDAEAMARLPIQAQKTAKSLQGVWKSMQNDIQNNFWAGMGDAMETAFQRFIPIVQRGLADAATHVGAFGAGVFRSFEKISFENGPLQQMFDNLSLFFDHAAEAAEPLFDAINRIGLRGSEFLPKFGQWLTDIAKGFDNWVTAADSAGDITRWIQRGADSLRDTWNVGGDLVEMFQAITRAANLAGTNGLGLFEKHLDETAKRMLGEPWQSRAATIFDGARDGASRLNDGFKNLKQTLGDASGWLSILLRQLGEIGGGALDGLSAILNRPHFQAGTIDALSGMGKLLSDLKPSFQNLGDIIGNLAKIAGSAFGSLGGTINSIMSLLDKVVATLADNVAQIVPKLMGSVGSIIQTLTPAIVAVAEGLNTVLGAFNALPGGITTAAAAVVTFLALRAGFSKFFEALNGTPYFQRLKDNFVTTQAMAGKTVETMDKFRLSHAVMQDLGDRIGGVRGQLVGLNEQAQVDGMGKFRSIMHTTGTAIQTGLGKAVSGLTGALGGPWGIAIMAATAAVVAFGKGQADTKAKVDALMESIDKQTGKLNDSALSKIAGDWTEVDKAGDAWANFWRGFVMHSKAANETAQQLGLNLSSITRSIKDGGPEYDSLLGRLKLLRDNLGGRALTDDGFLKSIGFTREQIKGLGNDDLQQLIDQMEGARAKVVLAEAAFAAMGQATGQTGVNAQIMAQAMQTIGDQAKDASSKIDAIRTSLDLLKGGSVSAREAMINSQRITQSAVEQAKALHDQIADTPNLISKVNGMLDTTTSAGLKLHDIMKSSADGILINAQAAYDAAIKAGDTPMVAMEKAQKIVDAGQQSLQQIADAAGVSVDTIRKDWDSFFGTKWELSATFSASADKFQAVRDGVQKSGLEWNDQIFKAFLDANPDPAKVTIETAKAWGEDYARKYWVSHLDAINKDALAGIAQAVGAGDGYKNGDYTGILKALNNTDPGIQQALRGIFSVTNGDYRAPIKVLEDAVHNAGVVQRSINSITGRTITIGITGDSSGFLNDYANAVQRAANMRQNIPWADGGIANGRGVKVFANGGINRFASGAENHVAQIARPSSIFRIWAEPETGGEAYIPLALSKRPRSLSILGQVAQQFGYGLTKFANGTAGVPTSSSTTEANVHIGTIVAVDVDEAISKLRQSQRDALAVAGLSSIGG